VISREGVPVLVVETDEERQIAREVEAADRGHSARE
jgi:acetate kinase